MYLIVPIQKAVSLADSEFLLDWFKTSQNGRLGRYGRSQKAEVWQSFKDSLWRFLFPSVSLEPRTAKKWRNRPAVSCSMQVLSLWKWTPPKDCLEHKQNGFKRSSVTWTSFYELSKGKVYLASAGSQRKFFLAHKEKQCSWTGILWSPHVIFALRRDLISYFTVIAIYRC